MASAAPQLGIAADQLVQGFNLLLDVVQKLAQAAPWSSVHPALSLRSVKVAVVRRGFEAVAVDALKLFLERRYLRFDLLDGRVVLVA
jgi:hypothetical protein